ncbi:MAG: DUF3139 domain-containing protein [Lachnospiraceae bacterium]|nr:DUF3139 domain-containing protein [Lachnospiraceae bacterium]
MSILNEKDKMVLKILAGIFVVPFTALFLIFPFQAYLTLCKFDEYRELQGIDSDLVIEKQLAFDIKKGGFNLFVKYSDDPYMRYNYHYDYWKKDNNGELIFDCFTLKKVNGGNDSIAMDVCEHPPIDGMI